MREAKDYLAGRIAAEAEQEGAPLTEVERKMLYFSETGWTLPGILEVNAEFERSYDEDEYERRIARLAAQIEARDAAHDLTEQARWDEALVRLSHGDHYLSVLVDPGFVPGAPVVRPPHDRLRLLSTALGLIVVWFLLELLLERVFWPDWRERLRHFFW
ncbi:MAG: hypothetical protein WCE75_03865 [Terracidiphilus sp.]